MSTFLKNNVKKRINSKTSLTIVLSIICIILSFFLPWYYVTYQYTSTSTNEYYESSAHIHAWYIYENVNCHMRNCTTETGALFSEEGLQLWLIGISEHRFGMRLIFLISWGLVCANAFVLLVSAIRRNKGKIVAYIAFLLSFFATIFFLLLPTTFTPCTWNFLYSQTGPCHSFHGHSYFDSEREFKWGPYAAWYTVAISSLFTAIGLFCSVFSPKPQYNPVEEDEEQKILRDSWKTGNYN